MFVEKYKMLIFRKSKKGREIINGAEIERGVYDELATFIIKKIASNPDREIGFDVLINEANNQPFTAHGNVRELLQVKQDLEARDVIKTVFRSKCNQVIILNQGKLKRLFNESALVFQSL